jgi:gas vesicle protein
MANRDNGNGAFIFGLIVGAIGGAVATLFLTPKSGDDLRKDIEATVNETAGPVLEKAEPLVAQGKERASELIDKAADRAQEVSGKIAAMDLPFEDDDGTYVEPAPTPPTAAEVAQEQKPTENS